MCIQSSIYDVYHVAIELISFNKIVQTQCQTTVDYLDVTNRSICITQTQEVYEL